MGGLPDYLDFGLKIVFVGYNPGESSALLGHHFAGRGNQFWRLLNEAGLTERLYRPEEDSLLLKEGYGLTNIVARPSKSSSDLTPGEMKGGALELRRKISGYRPAVACFLGKEIYRCYAGLKSAAPVKYGLVDNIMFPGIKEFVAPNSSGRSTIPYPEKLSVFSLLKLYSENDSRNCLI